MDDVTRWDATKVAAGFAAGLGAIFAAAPAQAQDKAAALPTVRYVELVVAVEKDLVINKDVFAAKMLTVNKGAGDYIAVAMASADSGEQRFAVLAITMRGVFKITKICEGGVLPAEGVTVQSLPTGDVLEVTNEKLGGGKYNKQVFVLTLS